MPTTFVGLLLFVALLAPGFTYLLVAERGPLPVRGASVLRETASVALTSVLFNAAAVIAVAIVRAAAPGLTPDIGRLVREGLPYLRTHYASIAWWSVGTLCLACLLAFVGATVLNATHRLASLRRKRVLRWLFPPGGVAHMSAWWKLLRDEEPRRRRRITCQLENGASVEGWLLSLNADVGETGDRELALSAPLVFTHPDGSSRQEPYGAISISARRIVTLYVDYQ